MTIKVISSSVNNTLSGVKNNLSNQKTTLQYYQENMMKQSSQNYSNFNTAIGTGNQSVVNNISLNTDSLSNAIRTQNTQLVSQVRNSVDTLKNAISAIDKNIVLDTSSFARAIQSQTDKTGIRHNELVKANQDNFNKLTNELKSTIDRATLAMSEKSGLTKDNTDRLAKSFVDTFIESLSGLDIDSIRNILSQLIGGTSEATEDGINYLAERLSNFVTVLDNLKEGEYSDLDTLLTDLASDRTTGNIIEIIIEILGLVPISFSLFKAVNAEALVELNRLALSESTPNLPTWLEIMTGIRRGIFTSDMGFDMMRDSGWSENLTRLLYDLSEDIPNPNELFELFRRGFINEDKLQDNLEANGYSRAWANVIKDLAYYIPTPQDVIRFSVRDVFDTQLAELSGIFEGWDNEDYLKYTRQSGIRDEDARLYWGAHWILPSVNQGYEMLFRQQINRNELEALFRGADIAPAWREKLLNIAYKVPTRVDTRRMFIADVISESETLDIIKAQGYDDRNANFLLDWYKKEKERSNSNTNEVRELTRSTILKGNRAGVISDNQAIQRLVELGYSSQDSALLLLMNSTENDLNEQVEYLDRQRIKMRRIYESSYMNRFINRNDAKIGLVQTGLSDFQANTLLDMLDKEFEIEYRSSIVEQMTKQFVGREITENQYRNTMLQYGFSGEEINKQIDKLNPMRDIRYRDLTTSQISKAVLGGILTVERGLEQLRGNGYSDNDALIIAQVEGWL